mmetsp:Transcript_71810/g.191676  ORF Transcript_71810/g.191676 Transcript_71810/m.191676 type:complete len:119 (+) Transcript_71810:426-782(+)|eukprot:CAMPEP_0113663648 /NCGR_PEP_ID=MMETSP0038_2-20120614/1275_1 /TAXON_ID=2898 /ORGANISM="Cryptomonas paramecium" /LENGTH=118 /DNA_ID=CAMNT_0000578731 /DNA_START=205 /DNA_END=561 /DNA_ORIENTATION=- /assembly_acc=CAM_ASM_000170
MAFSVLNVVDENLFPFAASVEHFKSTTKNSEIPPASDCVVSIPKPPPARRVAESVLHCVSEPCFAPHAPAPHLGTTKLPRTVSSIQLPGPLGKQLRVEDDQRARSIHAQALRNPPTQA